jgi:hypothetical protein
MPLAKALEDQLRALKISIPEIEFKIGTGTSGENVVFKTGVISFKDPELGLKGGSSKKSTRRKRSNRKRKQATKSKRAKRNRSLRNK